MDHVQAFSVFLLCLLSTVFIDIIKKKKTCLNTCPNLIVGFTKGNRFCLTPQGTYWHKILYALSLWGSIFTVRKFILIRISLVVIKPRASWLVKVYVISYYYRAFSHDVIAAMNIGVPKQWNGSHVGVPNQSCESWTLFVCKTLSSFAGKPEVASRNAGCFFRLGTLTRKYWGVS